MSNPEFFQPSSGNSWAGFLIFLAIVCLFFPSITMGAVIGIVWFYVIFYIVLKMMGGS